MDSSFIKCAVKKYFEIDLNKKIYFGGKYNFFK